MTSEDHTAAHAAVSRLDSATPPAGTTQMTTAISQYPVETLRCPYHHAPLIRKETVHGLRWECKQPDCTVACWGGSTSAPADDETRTLRALCHEEFDPLWSRKTVWYSRDQAYSWLARIMFMTREEAHIGRFDADQCREMLEQLRAFLWLRSFPYESSLRLSGRDR